jgi:hypothetical protein
VVDTVLNNTAPISRRGGGGETSIAINPRNPKELVITDFEISWSELGPGSAASLMHSTNGGDLWTEELSINPPQGRPVAGCPCDQTVDFARSGLLLGAFLSGETNIYTGSSDDATQPDFEFFPDGGGPAQRTNGLTATSINNADQPWQLTNLEPDDLGARVASLGNAMPVRSRDENVYVAYDDFGVSPVTMHVAVAPSTNQPAFGVDNSPGVAGCCTNPGHRLATDPVTGFVYSAWQHAEFPTFGGAVIDFMLNRSADGGLSWALNGASGGITVATTVSTQPTPKFCTVNALLGGVDHIATDPRDGSLYYVYGNRDPATGMNRLAIRHLTPDGMGGLTVGAESFATGQVQAAIPSVAVNQDGVVGVFYYTCDDDGTATGQFPRFTAHFSASDDGGATFNDNVLLTFLSPTKDNGNDRPARAWRLYADEDPAEKHGVLWQLLRQRCGGRRGDLADRSVLLPSRWLTHYRHWFYQTHSGPSAPANGPFLSG